MSRFNEKQKEILDIKKGIYVVDAGAGTGKTSTLTEKFVLLAKENDISDILMVTFTKNAASEMKKRVLNKLGSEGLDSTSKVNIMTFHGFCSDLLKNYGDIAPSFIGIEDSLINFDLIDEDFLEKDEFYFFFETFKQKNPKYHSFYDIVSDHSELLNIIKKMASRGIIPQKNGWLSDSKSILKGNKNIFEKLISEKNKLSEDASKNRKSALCKEINSLKHKLYNFDVSSLVEKRFAKENEILDLFDDSRKDFFEFIHDVYFNYLEFCVSNNYLNFDFLMLFAYVLLFNSKKIRDKNKFSFVLVDEFQDTNDLQFSITLLLMKSKNLIAVGDWKQGIYGFRNANLENITSFEYKIENLSKRINMNIIRSPLIRRKDVTKKFLIDNYRSAREILGIAHKIIENHSEGNEIVELQHNHDFTGKIRAIESDSRENEMKSIVKVIYELIKNKTFLKSENREIKFSDICVLTRDKKFAKELQIEAMKYNIPTFFDGGVDIFRSNFSILLLNWLRYILNPNDRNALLTILEYEDISAMRVEKIVKKKILPLELNNLKNKLKNDNSVNFVYDVFFYYGFDDIYSKTFLYEIVKRSQSMSTFEIMSFIENAINHHVSSRLMSEAEDQVILQTIHGSKGLEYPVVFISNINKRSFPSSIGNSDLFFYDDILGLRSNKKILKKPYSIVDNPISKILGKIIPRNSDEELRLFYVSITRAKEYLFFTASNPSKFFDYIKEHIVSEKYSDELLDFGSLLEEKSVENSSLLTLFSDLKSKKSVHDFMSLEDMNSEYIDVGNLFHFFSESFVKKGSDNLKTQIFEKKILDRGYAKELKELKLYLEDLNKKGELRSEVEIYGSYDGSKTRGAIDLLLKTKESYKIIDLKLELTNHSKEEYKTQLEIYSVLLEKITGKPNSIAIYDVLNKKEIVF